MKKTTIQIRDKLKIKDCFLMTRSDLCYIDAQLAGVVGFLEDLISENYKSAKETDRDKVFLKVLLSDLDRLCDAIDDAKIVLESARRLK